MHSLRTRLVASVLVGCLVAAGWLIAQRFQNYPATTHHHANFALYVNGVRDEFSNFTFYEEVQACSLEDHAAPRAKAHMHDHINHVVHVHDNSATWGDFFKGLGYELNDVSLKTDAGTFTNSQGTLSFVLNGKSVTSVASERINSEDVLLVSFGTEELNVLTTRFEAIERDAPEFNQKVDPSSCKGSSLPSFTDKLVYALQFWR